MVVGRNVHDGPLGVCLFWCFDQCSKLENHQVRQELNHAAAAAGCEFRCAKKSVDFLSWLGSKKETVLLIADWREAKPIQDELNNRRGISQHDVRICVVAAAVKTFRRASTWARQQHAAHIVVMSGPWLKGATELMQQRKTETCFSRDAAADAVVSTLTTTHEMFSRVSLPNLLKAVQDPQRAAELEHIIRQTMWQTYED